MSSDQIAHRGKVIRDPVHGLIELRRGEEFLLKLIDTCEFQRLRRIRQLGVSSITFPGAEHTRFAHSLGVLNFARRILDRLSLRYSDHAKISALIVEHGKTVKAAALLHDIGHGPFSHLIERAGVSMEKHEARTGEIITDENSEVNQVLQDQNIPSEDVRAIIDGTFPIRFLIDIVSSQLDADRMDYLLRDSLMSGVEYGRYDAEWIIQSLCLGLEPGQGIEAKPENLRLALDTVRGIHAAEQLVVARMHMSYQVYYHRVTRGWEAHLLCLLHIAGELEKAGDLPDDTPHVVAELVGGRRLDYLDFIRLDEPTMLSAFGGWAALEKGESGSEIDRLRSLSESFLNRRKVFKVDVTIQKNPLKASFEKVMELTKDGGRENIDFYHDDAKFRGYKDFGRSLAREDSTEGSDLSISSEAIFLASGDPDSRAIPVEQDQRALITPALTQKEERPLNRVFVHADFQKSL